MVKATSALGDRSSRFPTSVIRRIRESYGVRYDRLMSQNLLLPMQALVLVAPSLAVTVLQGPLTQAMGGSYVAR